MAPPSATHARRARSAESSSKKQWFLGAFVVGALAVCGALWVGAGSAFFRSDSGWAPADAAALRSSVDQVASHLEHTLARQVQAEPRNPEIALDYALVILKRFADVADPDQPSTGRHGNPRRVTTARRSARLDVEVLRRGQELLRRAASLAHNHSAVLLRIAREQRLHGFLEDALASFTRLLALKPTDSYLYVLGSDVASQLGRRNEAIALLQRALQLQPSSLYALSNLGNEYYLSGDLHNATAVLDQAVSLAPKRAEVLYNAAFMHEEAGSFDVAEKLYRRAVAAGGKNRIAALMRLGFTLAAAGDRDAAAHIFQQVVDESPRYVRAKHMLNAVRGTAVSSASISYIQAMYDNFAATYDARMVEAHRYALPARVADLVASVAQSARRIVDVGCGTGLVGAALRERLGANVSIHGIDASKLSVAKAEEKRVYDTVEHGDARALWSSRGTEGANAPYDIATAVGIATCCFNDLQPLMRGLSLLVREGGYVVLTVEEHAGAAHELAPTGRFVHALAYARDVATEYFEVVEAVRTSGFQQYNRSVPHAILLLRRPLPARGSFTCSRDGAVHEQAAEAAAGER